MSAVLVDSNVLIDIVSPGSAWQVWSNEALRRCAEIAPLIINPLIYAELSVQYDRAEELDELLGEDFLREPLPWEGAFLAGRAFVDYRRRGGTRTSPLPDFYIGAHAAVRGHDLLTRDARRYRSYFPTLTLIAPPEG